MPPYLGGLDTAAEFNIPSLPSSLAVGFNSQVIGGFSSPAIGRQLYGSDTYTGGFSKPTAAECGCTPASDPTSYELADFYFGLPDSIALGSNLTTNLRHHVNSLYAQDDWHVTSKLTVSMGLRREFATPVWDRDNYWSNFNPATNTLVRATNGSPYNRVLVNPDYSDWGPRLGMARSWDAKTSIRAGYGIGYDFLNRPGSAEEGINGPLAIFGLLNQSFPAGGPVPSGFLTTQNSFTTNLASTFNPINSNNVYIPANTRWPYVQSWILSLQREVAKNTVVEVAYTGNRSLRLPIIADYNQAAPNAVTATCNGTVTSGCLGVQARVPDPLFGPIGNEYRGEAILRPNVSGGATSQSAAQSLLTYFAGYSFATPSPNAPFGNLGRNAVPQRVLKRYEPHQLRVA